MHSTDGQLLYSYTCTLLIYAIIFGPCMGKITHLQWRLCKSSINGSFRPFANSLPSLLSLFKRWSYPVHTKYVYYVLYYIKYILYYFAFVVCGISCYINSKVMHNMSMLVTWIIFFVGAAVQWLCVGRTAGAWFRVSTHYTPQSFKILSVAWSVWGWVKEYHPEYWMIKFRLSTHYTLHSK